jgi:hypothetical protein
VGERDGSLWVVKEGLKPGERVIVEGVQKVRAGMPVTPKPFQEKPEKPGGPGALLQIDRQAG